MIKAVLVDDDPKNITILKTLLKEIKSGIEVTGEANNAEEAIRLIPQLSPNLVFLDIEMPFGNAFDLLDKLMPVNFEIIFITAFNEYSLKAFRYSALDYLLKPVDIDDLHLAVQKAEKKIELKNINSQLSNFLSTLNKPALSVTKIAIPVKEGFDFIDINTIISCESKNNCTIVHIQTGKKYTCTRTIKDYEDLLPEDSFFRIHYSHIVNVNFIRKFFKDGRGGYIELSDGTTLPVAYRRKDIFLSKFGFG
jgi:two-component system LytT family response regulator